MESFRNLMARDSISALSDGTNTYMVNLLIALFCLVFLGLLSFSLLMLLRRHRMKQAGLSRTALPQYNETKRTSNHRRLTIQTGNGRSSVIVLGRDGTPMLANPSSPPHSPDNVPQIHITFPDEHDENGRPRSGRAFVVRVGDTTVGLEPLHEEQLPAYEKDNKTRFYSVDIDKIGGLKEKEYR